MLWETLERVNRLRQQALANSEFVQSAKEHEQALHEQEYHYQPKNARSVKDRQGKKSLADIYKEVEFSADSRH
ncbi:hypothetical protein [Vibrio natriegens]|uniref:Uncharacterized protein n=1 Tax=Vibrio natriegens NBRC 15636 = ATCC 14048 = DSM 759 TaxID=1219067 RepID=A0AAN0Y1V0_VIBNA|nr:hypothetical protein [Vibrio natriegens]ALR15575.1 hypothetical protein PN96_06115 [Vibrio natriegens NBRC 15636 = ATCC 14048 = DSM 759]ANQ12568.1 hypothetical protein BA890_07235 [Vibrio natriegens NBRC 15636 = ATCC 14048 = DSM 759]EPM42392.1 hypothetical protein M272_02745 [Vibrio natriegens NBRC 15636 = ATCC 14048 = DSM 759]MDX6026955.1 hypothetical protein [Vibrio natriegens NBRC 15636 = ATCC 14048 = DSM 759]UUI13038.1 hypothetical protein NP431_07270 [Vibrio natriegens]